MLKFYSSKKGMKIINNQMGIKTDNLNFALKGEDL